jgi:hypothetical protein
MTELSFITVNFHSSNHVHRLVKKVASQYPESEILVFDNSPHTDPVGIQAENVKVMDWGHNVGFARACNICYHIAANRYVFLINPDCQPLVDLRRLVYYFDFDPGIVGICPSLVYPNGELQRYGFNLFSYKTILLNQLLPNTLLNRLKFVQYEKLLSVDWQDNFYLEAPAAAALLLDSERLSRIGIKDSLFDETFPLFWNDLEFAKRVKIRGGTFYHVHNVQIVHHAHGCGTSEKRYMDKILYLYYASILDYTKKYYPARFVILLRTVLLSKYFFKSIISLMKGKMDSLKVFIYLLHKRKPVLILKDLV